MKKPKKKKGRRQTHTESVDASEKNDELVALGAIFGDDLEIQEDCEGFRLFVQPHPGEAAANHVSLYLKVV